MPFSSGENVVFSMFYGPIPAGSGVLTVKMDSLHGDTLYHASSIMRTNRFFSFFYKIDDRVDSFFTPDSFLPIRFTKSIREGSYKENLSCDFHNEDGIAIYSDGDTVELAPSAKDYLASIYYVRTLDLSEKREITLVNHTNKKNYELKVKVHTREEIRTPLGDFECIVVDLISESGGMFSRGSLRVWLTDDERRIPVQLETKLPIGSIIALLRKLELGRKEG